MLLKVPDRTLNSASFDDCIRCYQLADLIVYNFILNGNFIARFKLFRILLAYVFQLMIYTKRMTHFREDGLYSFNYRIIFIRNDSFILPSGNRFFILPIRGIKALASGKLSVISKSKITFSFVATTHIDLYLNFFRNYSAYQKQLIDIDFYVIGTSDY